MLYSLFFLVATFVAMTFSLPILDIDGFTWAENLCFDGLGNLFVSDSVRGEIWKINLCADDEQSYCKTLLLNGFRCINGITPSQKGDILYAGARFKDDSTGIIAINTQTQDYEVIAKTTIMPNGLALDWDHDILYYTNEGDRDGGFVYSVNIANGIEQIVYSQLSGADGAWIDQETNFLFIGSLKQSILVFQIDNNGLATLYQEYPGLSSVMLDDLTTFDKVSSTSMNDTILLGADFTGRQIMKFDMNGKVIESITNPDNLSLHSVTSVRWGKGPGFDTNSIYVTQGGGLLPTQKDRHVYQIQLNK